MHQTSVNITWLIISRSKSSNDQLETDGMNVHLSLPSCCPMTWNGASTHLSQGRVPKHYLKVSITPWTCHANNSDIARAKQSCHDYGNHTAKQYQAYLLHKFISLFTSITSVLPHNPVTGCLPKSFTLQEREQTTACSKILNQQQFLTSESYSTQELGENRTENINSL